MPGFILIIVAFIMNGPTANLIFPSSLFIPLYTVTYFIPMKNILPWGSGVYVQSILFCNLKVLNSNGSTSKGAIGGGGGVWERKSDDMR